VSANRGPALSSPVLERRRPCRWGRVLTRIRRCSCCPANGRRVPAVALELRDGGKKHFGGKGVAKAVANVNEAIAPAVAGLRCRSGPESGTRPTSPGHYCGARAHRFGVAAAIVDRLGSQAVRRPSASGQARHDPFALGLLPHAGEPAEQHASDRPRATHSLAVDVFNPSVGPRKQPDTNPGRAGSRLGRGT
jgi:hypothetical protein